MAHITNYMIQTVPSYCAEHTKLFYPACINSDSAITVCENYSVGLPETDRFFLDAGGFMVVVR